MLHTLILQSIYPRSPSLRISALHPVRNCLYPTQSIHPKHKQVQHTTPNRTQSNQPSLINPTLIHNPSGTARQVRTEAKYGSYEVQTRHGQNQQKKIFLQDFFVVF